MSLPPDEFPRCKDDELDGKEILRRQIAMHVAHYLSQGGTIEHIPAGKQIEAERRFDKLDLINHIKRRTRAVYDLKRRRKR